jgi:hypothetical protein
MKVGQYVKLNGLDTYGTVTRTWAFSEEGQETIAIVDVLLDGDAEVTEFHPRELVPHRRPKSARGKVHFRKDINDSAARRNALQGKGFIPTPQAGVFTPEDLQPLKDAQRKAYAAQAMREKNEARPLPAIRERETIGNTTRYWQVPGTSTLHGGRND